MLCKYRGRDWRDDAGSQGISAKSPSLPKLEETRIDTLLDPSEGVLLNQHLYFGLLSSRTVKEYISVVLKEK